MFGREDKGGRMGDAWDVARVTCFWRAMKAGYVTGA